MFKKIIDELKTFKDFWLVSSYNSVKTVKEFLELVVYILLYFLIGAGVASILKFISPNADIFNILLASAIITFFIFLIYAIWILPITLDYKIYRKIRKKKGDK